MINKVYEVKSRKGLQYFVYDKEQGIMGMYNEDEVEDIFPDDRDFEIIELRIK